MKKIFLPFIFLLLGKFSFAQTDSSSSLTFTGYAEVYYSYDFGQPSNHERPAFFYNYNRHNEANLNLGFIQANYSGKRVRGTFALMAGTYPQYNLSGEQGLLKNVWQANAGFKLCKKKDLWVDGGIFLSHIGFEDPKGTDCWNLTRSLFAENVPSYVSGVKINYTSDNSKWYFALMEINGWNRIQRIPGNNTPAFGTQITFKPTGSVTLNYSTFYGNEKPDTAQQWRLYNNLYGIFQVTKKFGITADVDYGMEQKSPGSSDYNTVLTGGLILKYQVSNKIALAARGEYYMDENGVLIATGTPNGFNTFGYSLNLDYSFSNNLVWRIEGRGLNSKDEIFTMDNRPSTQNYFITTSIAFNFSR